MNRRLLTRAASMTSRELRWRAVSAARNTLHRSGALISAPSWNRSALARVLLEGTPAAEAARRADWFGVHHALSRALQEDPPRFLIGPRLRDDVVRQVRSLVPGSVADATGAADAILDGRFALLGYTDLRFASAPGAPPDWHFDPVHGRRAPQVFWSSVPYLDAACGDHKVIWELNRHQHLLALGRAFWLSGEERYREQAIEHLTSWIEANRPLMGINWASMLELAFRSLSWIWAMHLLADEQVSDLGGPWLADAAMALDRQLVHIEHNLSYYFSPNTHLVGEALALYVAGRALPWLQRADTYATIGRRVLVEQIERQIAPDGGHLERSTHYHRYTLDFYLMALAIARVTGDPVARSFEAVVARLAGAARLLADDNGRLPHIGDDDGGLAFPMCGREPDDIRDTLSVAAALLGQPELNVGPVCEETLWLLAHPAFASNRRTLEGLVPPRTVASGALSDTGYYVSRANDGTHLVFDAGAHGFANGGHAHADALSLTLSVRGAPLIVDPGTASYTADLELRDRFRSSALHNTVTVDGRSQSLPAGPFHWSRITDATADRWRSHAQFDYVEGHHAGYLPLVHRRSVFVLHGDAVVVADIVDGTGEHDLALHWHLDPEWVARASGRQIVLLGKDRVTCAVSRGSVSLVHGSEREWLGWCAPVYGRLQRTTTIRVSERAALPLCIVSVFGLDERNDLVRVEPFALDRDNRDAMPAFGARIVRTGGEDLFALRLPATRSPQRWMVDGIETDARMVFWRHSGPRPQVALVDGSFAVRAGAPAPVRLDGIQQAAHVFLPAVTGHAVPACSVLTGAEVK